MIEITPLSYELVINLTFISINHNKLLTYCYVKTKKIYKITCNILIHTLHKLCVFTHTDNGPNILVSSDYQERKISIMRRD